MKLVSEVSGFSSKGSFYFIFISNNVIMPFSKLHFSFYKSLLLGFPGGVVVKNLPANSGDMDLSPGLGRSHMPVRHNY